MDSNDANVFYNNASWLAILLRCFMWEFDTDGLVPPAKKRFTPLALRKGKEKENCQTSFLIIKLFCNFNIVLFIGSIEHIHYLNCMLFSNVFIILCFFL